jgi:hypothetical protein
MEPKNQRVDSNNIFSESTTEPIERVFEGMRVEDANGEEIGVVSLVRMGDPEAATTGEQPQQQGGGLMQNLQEAFGGNDDPDVPPSIRERLLRIGYLKVEGRGLTGRDVYVPADHVASVTGDTVRLTVLSERLEHGS